MSASKSNYLEVFAPLSGVIVPLGEVPDPAFATEIVGDGIAIDPISCVLLAPVAGTIIHLHRAKHALILRSDEGPELLLHLGLDTVMLNGEGFDPMVQQGDHVLAGQSLIAFDPVVLGRKARSLLTLVVFPNGDRVRPSLPVRGVVAGGKDRILEVELKAGEAAPAPGAAPVLGGQAQSRPILLPNPLGLHARPAAALATVAKTYLSSIILVKGNEEANAKSAVSIMGLGTVQGDVLRLRASGSDAHSALAVLAELLENGCGEDLAAVPAAPAPVRPTTAPALGLGGVPASPGLALGRIFQFHPRLPEIPEEGSDPSVEMSRLESALRESCGRIDALKALIGHGGPSERDGILAAHQELLADPDLSRIAFAWIAKPASTTTKAKRKPKTAPAAVAA